MTKIIFSILISLLLASCEGRDFSFKESSKGNLTVTTFNAEWLGDGINDRKARAENDYKLIAEMLLDLNTDFIALQEIENEAALKKLTKYMPDYYYIIEADTKDKQNIAALFNKSIQALFKREANEIDVKGEETRPGLIVELKKGNLEIQALIVHFKSTSRYDSTDAMKMESRKIRLQQSEAVVDLLKKEYAKGKKNYILLGDLNDFPSRINNNTLFPIISYDKAEFLTDKLKSCRFQFSYSIDNIVISKELKSKYIKNSLRMYDIPAAFPEKEAKIISDHCPVSVSFEIN